MKWALVIFLVLFVLAIVSGCTEAMQGALEAYAEVTVTEPLLENSRTLEDRREEVVNFIEEAEKEIARLQRLEAENAVEADFLIEDIELLNTKKTQVRLEMLQLADYIEVGEPLTLRDGTAVSVDELAEFGERRIAEYERLADRIASKQTTLAIYEQSAADAHVRWTEGEYIVVELKDKLEVVDARIEALRVLQSQNPLLLERDSFDDAIAKAQEVADTILADLEKAQRTAALMGEVTAENRDAEIAAEIGAAIAGEGTTDIVSRLRTTAGERSQ